MHSVATTLHLVEDDLHFSISQKMELEGYGYTVITASSGEEAIELLHSRDDIDLILMDIDLGCGMDGTETARAILEELDIPIIFLSSHNSPEIVKRTENINSYGYVIKDAGTTVLDMTIKTALRLYNERINAKDIERELSANKERLSKAIDAGKQGFWDWNLETDTLYVNRQYYTMLGYEPDDLTTRRESWMDIMHPEDQEHVLPEILYNITSGEPYSTEFRLQCRDGSWKWISSQGKSYEFTDEGVPTRAVGVLIDIDEKKKEECENVLLFQRMNAALTIGNLSWWEMRLPSGKVIFDDRKAEMLGFSPDQFSHYSDFTDLLHPDDYEKAMQAVRDHLDGSADIYDVEYRIQTADGSYRWFHDIGGITERNTETGETLLIGIAQDITERKIIEEELRKSEELARSIIETAEDSIFIKDRDGVYTMVNPAMEKLFGHDAADIIGKTDHDLFGEEAGKAVKKSDEAVYRGETVEEFPGKPVNGILHTFHTIKVPLYDSEGNIAGLCGIARDITQQKQQQEHLRICKLAIDNSLTGIAVADIHYCITYVNPACLTIWEFDSIDEVIGRSIFDFWKDRETIHEDMQDILNGHKLYVESESYRKDGSKRIILVSATKVDDANSKDETLGIIANFLDITEKKAAEKQLQIEFDKKHELLRELQHRAKNSFNTIKSLMHIKSMSLSNQEAIETIEELRTRVHALAELYTMLYDTDSPDLIDLGEYCKRVAYLTAEMTVHISINKTMDSVQSNTRNAATIGLILTELITNAIKYAFPDGNGGTIKCELKKQDDGAVLIVEDNGVGMPEDFDLNNTSSMGLMLVRSMVKQLGGSMEIESDNSTRFTITLPELI